MSREADHQVVVITGASSGIGRGVAGAFPPVERTSSWLRAGLTR